MKGGVDHSIPPFFVVSKCVYVYKNLFIIIKLADKNGLLMYICRIMWNSK